MTRSLQVSFAGNDRSMCWNQCFMNILAVTAQVNTALTHPKPALASRFIDASSTVRVSEMGSILGGSCRAAG